MSTSIRQPRSVLPSRSWNRFRRNRPAVASAVMLSIFLLIGLISLPLSTSRYDTQSLDHIRAGPSIATLGGIIGFDSLGRSLLHRCLLGGVISITIGLFAATLSVTLGVVWGASAALAGGKTELILMRIVDVLYGLPYILLVILLKVAMDAPLTRLFDNSRVANVVILFVAIGANSWLTMARVIRGQVLSLREQPFIEAARAYGASRFRILRRHLLPNLVGPMVVYGSLIVPQAILGESFLSFLGIGIQRPVPTWGSLAADGLHAVNSVVNYWWLIVFPCGLLSLTLLALNFIGDGLRDAFDPKST